MYEYCKEINDSASLPFNDLGFEEEITDNIWKIRPLLLQQLSKMRLILSDFNKMVIMLYNYKYKGFKRVKRFIQFNTTNGEFCSKQYLKTDLWPSKMIRSDFNIYH